MNACLAPQPSADVQQRLRDFIAAPDYPCVGAKTALSRDQIHCIQAGDLRRPDFDTRIAQALQAFVSHADQLPMFSSAIVTFEDTPRLTERAFEDALWQRLQALHGIDACQFDWDTRVSADPASRDFAFSLGGEGFFVIGLHPGASRKARRFDCAALVFNLACQFEQLRQENRFDRVRGIIAKRDLAFSGSVNPMLARHGEKSDAPQYSGRKVDAHWRCPFHVTKGNDAP